SAGVTRPDRPGLDLSKQPPAYLYIYIYICRVRYQERRLLRFVLRRWKAPMHLARHLRSRPDLCPLIVCLDPQYPPPEKDYNVYFKTLKDGITGKEILEQDHVPV
ncbi:unnamed protein product, partial [Prunus brigantina]